MAFFPTTFKRYAALSVAGLALASYTFRDQLGTPPPKDAILLQALLEGLRFAHYEPVKVDDKLSKRIYDLYLKRIDGQKRFLLQADVARLARYQTELDDETQHGTHAFLDLSTQLLTQRLGEVQSIYREVLAKPFDFTVTESLETEPDRLDYPADAAALRDRWRKLLKYQTLTQLSDLMDEQAKRPEKTLAATSVKPSPATFAQPTPAALEADARKRVLKRYDEYFHDLLQLDAQDRLNQYANAVVQAYDPHTEYFAPQAKDNFDIALTGRLEGTGAQLGEQEGKITVTYIVPGSASFRLGEPKVGDVILKVAQGDADPVPVEGMRFDKVVAMVRGKKGTEVRLTVRKPDASVKVVSIIRDVVVLEDTYAQSAVVNEHGHKLGYIYLPAFYADFNRTGGRNSADDVKQELEKLKKENVEGVVIDLRSNGGGSLQDAVDMAGLFLPQGPMVQVKGSRGPAQVLRDADPTVQYGGPLVLLVNRYSASASEVLAAALQDHKRAIIVGGNTFGKGTVQRVLDLDAMMPQEWESLRPFGSLKVTIQKYYRVNGGSTQFKGIVPDIALPDAYSFGQTEQQMDYALGWDEIAPATYQPWANAPKLAKLRTASQQRVAASPGFRLLNEALQTVQQRKANTQVPLNLTAYRTEQQRRQTDANKFDAAQKAAPALDVVAVSADVQKASTDSLQTGRTARFVKPLKKDLTLHEAVAVLEDALGG
ncbi:tail-specific protease [Hymenobacter busanensis]|uniref:Tail-specific protease n=1 Tax=Hymenobacter busanensis TaxID=2607656 RepID=A0A7L4ZTV9_9BACT|nr:carboxy terminal-processing peptidase [Hymenobacter busanensis]KAA9339684.1 tail-specific protease [Hymenobacter busanensis]QHJ06561.1 tail-specific protease [Hymenobacter busanensis]